MTSSPGSTTASIPEIIASVDPQWTHSMVSGSTPIPYTEANFVAIASRNGLAPHVIAYWLTSAAMARAAASLISVGAGKSGKPCARLIAWCAIAIRVISRITLSVNDAAFLEMLISRMTVCRLRMHVERSWEQWPELLEHLVGIGEMDRVQA